jgi:peptidoglycan hydrolase-like protein with peptidoglycan-binding domain
LHLPIGLKPLVVGGRRAWSALLSEGTTPHLNKGDNGKTIVRLQLALRSAGFANGPTTAAQGPQVVTGNKEPGLILCRLWPLAV